MAEKKETQEDIAVAAPVEKPKVKSTRKVRPVQFKVDRKREYVLIADSANPSQVWLMERELVPGDQEFTVLETDLARCAKPYDFTAEIKKLMPSNKDVLHAFWLKGIITKDDLADIQRVRNALASVAPSASSFTKYTKEV